MEQAAEHTKKRSESRQRRRRFQIRILETEYQELKTLAEREGLAVGSYIRRHAIEQPLKKPTTRAKHRPTVNHQLLGQLLTDLRRVGNNMNQLAKRQNSGDSLTRAELEAGLAEHRQILAALITMLGKDKK